MSEKARNKIVFILGMHRSGTSLTAEIVHSLGFAVPGTSLDAIDSVNAHGFWESREVVDINERILSAAQLKWYHICPVGHVFSNLSDAQDFSAEISAFIKAESDLRGDLVIKDPRICLVWPLWFSAIDESEFDVKVVFVNRHPSSIASSIRIRDGFSSFSSHLLWLYYLFSVFGQNNFPRVLFLNYEDILIDESLGRGISDFLEAPAIDRVTWDKMVDSGLQRNVSKDFFGSSLIFDLERRVHGSFLHGSIYEDFEFIANESKEFESFIFNSSDLIFSLNESNNCIVESRSDLILMGSMHSDALRVIEEKDFAIFENSAYIDSCHARIAELDYCVLELGAANARAALLEEQLSILGEGLARNSIYISECEARIFDLEFSMSEFVALRARLEDVEIILRQKEDGEARNAEYIASAEARIEELHFAMRDFEDLRERIKEVESVLRQKEEDEFRNAEYIASAEARIAELHFSMHEFEALRDRIKEVELVLKEKEFYENQNAEYISRCHLRIHELEDIFSQQRNNYLSALNTISQSEKKLASRNAEFFSVMDELSDLSSRLESLLSWRIVRILDRHLSKKGEQSD